MFMIDGLERNDLPINLELHTEDVVVAVRLAVGEASVAVHQIRAGVMSHDVNVSVWKVCQDKVAEFRICNNDKRKVI